MKYGAKVKVSEEERMMATKSEEKIPDSNDLPSTWPDSWREHAEKLGETVISKWEDEVCAQLRKFTILYVPRASEMEKDTKNQDSWKFWLESLCSKENIMFIDPTPELLKVRLSGGNVFYDHFSKEGHLAFADAFVKWFKKDSSKTAKN